MTINKQKIINTRKERKTVPINIRITGSMSKWLKKNKYRPTLLFTEATKELGYKGE